MYYLNEITELQGWISNAKAERFELQKSNNLKIKEVLDGYFNPFGEYQIQVNRESATFHAEDETGRNKELFSISFYERYKEDTRLELSYYSTNTQSEFELDRLISLGEVARCIKSRSEHILKDLLDAKKSDDERLRQLYEIEFGYEKKVSEYQKLASEAKKGKITNNLITEGVGFSKGVRIMLKHNFTPKITFIKLQDFSKSGKKATATFMYEHHDTLFSEQNVDVAKVADQVASGYQHIVSTSELV